MEINVLCDKLSELYTMYVNEDIIALREFYRTAISYLITMICQCLANEGLIKDDDIKERSK